jgi:hypothetical protein
MPKKVRTQAAIPDVPDEVAKIRGKLNELLNTRDANGVKPFNAQCGIYIFYDYDGEPIYVGQTQERLRTRIRRHLTNQRTDAVAMNVLDPFEVADVEIYPFYDLEKRQGTETDAQRKDRIKKVLANAEYAVFQKVLNASTLGAVLNEADISPGNPITLPQTVKGRIIPEDIYQLRKHPDVRIARRASTVANLARVISEREVSSGLRRTLLTQTRRLELLARQRFEQVIGIQPIPIEQPGKETGEDQEFDDNE